MSKIRVLIVDDAVVVRKIVADVLAADPEIEVAGIAANGRIALSKIPQVNPDVVTMDVEMPEMNGIETVRAIRVTYPKLPVIMFSTLTETGTGATIDALLAGADDYVTKPANVGSVTLAMTRIRNELIPKIKALRNGRGRVAPGVVAAFPPAPAPTQLARRPALTLHLPGNALRILAIGCSTGGPNALADIVPKLPKDLPVPIVIVQHMPPLFTKMLADRLSAQWGNTVKEVTGTEPLHPGWAYVAPGNQHMVVAGHGDGLRVELNQDPPENSCRPAVDVLLRSVATACGSRAMACILTGMGADGLRGCEAIHKAGGRIVAQDQATSVVWGMPGAVVNANLADRILPLNEIASYLASAVQEGRTSRPAISKTA